MTQVELQIIALEEVETYPEHFNSSAHSEQEVSHIRVPSLSPTFFAHWVALAQRSQDAHIAFQICPVSDKDARALIRISTSAIMIGHLNASDREDLKETSLHKSLEKALVSFTDNQVAKVFVRLDYCSPKDGVHGIKPLATAMEIIESIVTSFRARMALQMDHEFRNIYVLPFNEEMSTEKELRCFARPGDAALVAVSQYRWWRPCTYLSDRDEESQHATASTIVGCVPPVLQEVLQEARGKTFEAELLEQGFVFDCLWKPEVSRCQLVELNTFGPRSTCGSALFHWIRDADLLWRNSSDKRVLIRIMK